MLEIVFGLRPGYTKLPNEILHAHIFVLGCVKSTGINFLNFHYIPIYCQGSYIFAHFSKIIQAAATPSTSLDSALTKLT